MKLNQEELNMLLRTVKIEVNEEEATKLQEDSMKLKDWFESIEEMNTEEVAPTFYNYYGGNVQREDNPRVTSEEKKKKLFNIAENFKEGFYRVPPIIE